MQTSMLSGIAIDTALTMSRSKVTVCNTVSRVHGQLQDIDAHRHHTVTSQRKQLQLDLDSESCL